MQLSRWAVGQTRLCRLWQTTVLSSRLSSTRSFSTVLSHSIRTSQSKKYSHSSCDGLGWLSGRTEQGGREDRVRLTRAVTPEK